MYQVNQQVLDNQNGVIESAEERMERLDKEAYEEMEKYYREIESKYEDLFEPFMLKKIAEYVLTEYKLEKNDDYFFLDSLLGNNKKDCYVGKSILNYLEYAGMNKDQEDHSQYYQDQKIAKLEETIESLQAQLDYIISSKQDNTDNTRVVKGNGKKVGWMKRPISQYTSDGKKWLRNWDSPLKVNEVLGFSAHAIVEQLKRVNGSSAGYHWKIGHFTKESK